MKQTLFQNNKELNKKRLKTSQERSSKEPSSKLSSKRKHKLSLAKDNKRTKFQIMNLLAKELLSTTVLALNLARKERKLRQLSSLELMRLIDVGITKYQLITGKTALQEEILPSREEMLKELRLTVTKKSEVSSYVSHMDELNFED